MQPEELDEWLDKEASHQVEPTRRHHPKGWEPGVRFDPRTGEGTATLRTPDAHYLPGQHPNWQPLLEECGFGELIEVLEVIDARSWEQKPGAWCHYVKCRVRHRDPQGVRIDVDAIAKRIRKHKPKTRARKPKLERTARVVANADWQLGKPDGDGTLGTVERILDMIEKVRAMLKREKPEWLIAAGMGDLTENVCGFYPMQTFSVELNRRDQIKLCRRLLVHATERWAPCVPKMTWVFVPGNHGENRQGTGKAYTTFGDNADLEVGEQLADIFKDAPAYQHLQFLIPDEELTITMDVFGQVLGLAHAHQAARKGSARSQTATCQAKVMNWWRDMAHARHPIGEADVLLTGHYHHLQCVFVGSRIWVQCPSMDGGSQWFEEQGGASSPGGTVTFTMGEHGFGNLEVIR